MYPAFFIRVVDMWKEEELRTNMAATQHSTRCCLLPLFTHFIFWMVWVNASAAWLTQSVYSFLLLKLPFLNVNHMLGCTGSLIASRKHHDTVDAHRLWTKHDRWRDEKKKDPVPPPVYLNNGQSQSACLSLNENSVYTNALYCCGTIKHSPLCVLRTPCRLPSPAP